MKKSDDLRRERDQRLAELATERTRFCNLAMSKILASELPGCGGTFSDIVDEDELTIEELREIVEREFDEAERECEVDFDEMIEAERHHEERLAADAAIAAACGAIDAALAADELEWRGTLSQYAMLDIENDALQIRVSDHPAVPNGGYLVRETAHGIEEGRTGDPDVDVVVTGDGKVAVRAVTAKAAALAERLSAAIPPIIVENADV